MSVPIISVEGVSKEYMISHQASYGTLRDSLTNFFTRSFRKNEPASREIFHALQDINFSVESGERVGIIGRNGAGKSTLLKILSQITPPTKGRVTLRGRVASLLEVGTGFHAELTGRENIFLNGAILGMKQSEIRKKFDEIVAFAEIEKFLDTPVKRYSSGMYVRLAFAVAAHLESEILIVDEVLAVGDAQFQKKCLDKMGEIGKYGRTVLFVSHNMAAINQLCNRAILLNSGVLVSDDTPEKIINSYFSQTGKQEARIDLSAPNLRKNSSKTSGVRWSSISLKNSLDQLTDHFGFHEPFSIELGVVVSRPVKDAQLAFAIQSALGFPLFNSFQNESGLPSSYEPGKYFFTAKMDDNPLSPGLYEISLGANGPGITDWIPTAMQFTIATVSANGKESWGQNKGGIITHPIHWEMTKELPS